MISTRMLFCIGGQQLTAYMAGSVHDLPTQQSRGILAMATLVVVLDDSHDHWPVPVKDRYGLFSKEIAATALSTPAQILEQLQEQLHARKHLQGQENR